MENSDRVKYINAKAIADHKFKTAGVCMMLRRPLKRGEATMNALLADVLSAGSAKYPNLYEINKYMEELYGAVFNGQIVKKGEFQIIRFYMEFIARPDYALMEKAIDFLKEILLNPLVENGSFFEEIVENEKAQLKDGIEERINDKNEYVRLKCVEHMCKEEPFGIYADGYAEDLDKIDAKSLYGHYKNIMMSTPLEFIATGDIDGNEFEHLIEERFQNPGYRPGPMGVGDILYAPKAADRHEERLNISQGKICMGLRADGDYKGRGLQILLVMNEILGGSGNSKLFMNLREKESLCYNIMSFVYRFKAIVMIQSGVENKNIELALEKINEQLDAMKNNEISPDELHMAKQGLIAGFKSMSDYQGALLDFYYTQYILGDRQTPADMVAAVESITAEEVSRMAQTLYTDTIYVLKGEDNGQTA